MTTTPDTLRALTRLPANDRARLELAHDGPIAARALPAGTGGGVLGPADDRVALAALTDAELSSHAQALAAQSRRTWASIRRRARVLKALRAEIAVFAWIRRRKGAVESEARRRLRP